MARETIFRCDVCSASEDVRTVKIVDGSTWEVDLCAKHREPLVKIVKHGREVAAPGSGRRDPSRTYDDMVRGVDKEGEP